MFSKAKTSENPPHRLCDCAIDLLPSLPHNKIYPLSRTEQAAMEAYVQEALKQGHVISWDSL